MDNDPISQLPEPYRAAWRILHESSKLEVVLKQTLEKAKEIASADWGAVVLKLDIEEHPPLPCLTYISQLGLTYAVQPPEIRR